MTTKVILQDAQGATKRQLEKFEERKNMLGDRLLNAYMSKGNYLVIESKETGWYWKRIYGVRGGCTDTYCYTHYNFEDNIPYKEIFHKSHH